MASVAPDLVPCAPVPSKVSQRLQGFAKLSFWSVNAMLVYFMEIITHRGSTLTLDQARGLWFDCQASKLTKRPA